MLSALSNSTHSTLRHAIDIASEYIYVGIEVGNNPLVVAVLVDVHAVRLLW